MNSHDVLIIGSGLAGMSAALRLADRHRVALVTKHELLDGASSWAQGGIAAVLDQSDSVEDHIRDTLVAGAGLCREETVRFVVERGRRAVEWLVAQGVPFTRDDDNQDELHLTREGGHSHRRIVHAADATGSAVIASFTVCAICLLASSLSGVLMSRSPVASSKPSASSLSNSVDVGARRPSAMR